MEIPEDKNKEKEKKENNDNIIDINMNKKDKEYLLIGGFPDFEESLKKRGWNKR